MTSIVPWTYKDLIWSVDKNIKFVNPPIEAGKNLCDSFKANLILFKIFFQDTVKPPNWKVSACELDKNDPDNNGFLNSDFIIWMRTAALPDFRKPYRKLIRTGDFLDGLPAGNYILTIKNCMFFFIKTGRSTR